MTTTGFGQTWKAFGKGDEENQRWLDRIQPAATIAAHLAEIAGLRVQLAAAREALERLKLGIDDFRKWQAMAPRAHISAATLQEWEQIVLGALDRPEEG